MLIRTSARETCRCNNCNQRGMRIADLELGLNGHSYACHNMLPRHSLPREGAG